MTDHAPRVVVPYGIHTSKSTTYHATEACGQLSQSPRLKRVKLGFALAGGQRACQQCIGGN